MRVFLDFEQKIAELENKIEELRHLSDSGGVNIADEVSKLQSSGPAPAFDLSIAHAVAKVLVARHPKRLTSGIMRTFVGGIHTIRRRP